MYVSIFCKLILIFAIIGISSSLSIRELIGDDDVEPYYDEREDNRMLDPYVSRRGNVRSDSHRKSDRYYGGTSDSDSYEEPRRRRRLEKNRKQRRPEKRADAEDDDYHHYSAEYPEVKSRPNKKSTRHRKNTRNEDQSPVQELEQPKKRERKISSDRKSKNGIGKDYEEDILVGEKPKKRRPTTSKRRKSGRDVVEASDEWGAAKESRKNEPNYYGGWPKDGSWRADQWESGRVSSKENYERRRKNKIDKIRRRKEKMDKKKRDQEEDSSYEPKNKAVWVSLQ